MVKFRFPRRGTTTRKAILIIAVTMHGRPEPLTACILRRRLKFESNSTLSILTRIRFDIGQKPRLIANDSFKPVC